MMAARCLNLKKFHLFIFLVEILSTFADVIRPLSVACPKACDCFWRQADCSDHSLLSIPEGFDVGIDEIDLRRNRISDISYVDFKQLKFLQKLDVSENFLAFIPGDTFQLNRRLRIINLNDNRLNSIPGDSFGENNSITHLHLARNQIHSIRREDLDRLTNLNELDLSGNKIAFLPSFLFESLPALSIFRISDNRLIGVVNLLTGGQHMIRSFDLSHNEISSVFLPATTSFPMLETLNLTQNNLTSIDADWFISMSSLTFLSLNSNPVDSLEGSAFLHCQSLEVLQLSHLKLKSLRDEVFSGLDRLVELDISGNSNLKKIETLAFSGLGRLRSLNLSDNSLQLLSEQTLMTLTSLKELDLGKNNWSCDCRFFDFLKSLHLNIEDGLILGSDFICMQPERLQNRLAVEIPLDELRCDEISFKIGSTAIIDCPAYLEPELEIIWTTNRDEYFSLNHSTIDNSEDFESVLTLNEEANSRLRVLNNGSLMITYVERWDGGRYECILKNRFGNSSRIVTMTLDYRIVSEVAIECLYVGFLSAFVLFLFAVVVGTVRRCMYACNAEERAKRKSIREVLNDIRSGAQLEKLSAYRSTKMDQFYAFRSATLDQLSAFTNAKISKLRTYKQMTVTNVLQHLERMRQHYALQTARIKENCTAQVEKLRENYTAQKERLKDHRSQHMRKMRTNYDAQTLKIREYRTQQMVRLREQYKLQQQHLLKLLELLDVGNCVTVIEAECVRTESTIFDADIVVDVEAQSIHARHDDDSNDIKDFSIFASEDDSLSLTGDQYSIAVSQTGEDDLNRGWGGVVVASACDEKNEGRESPRKSSKEPIKGILEVEIERGCSIDRNEILSLTEDSTDDDRRETETVL